MAKGTTPYSWKAFIGCTRNCALFSKQNFRTKMLLFRFIRALFENFVCFDNTNKRRFELDVRISNCQSIVTLYVHIGTILFLGQSYAGVIIAPTSRDQYC